MADVVNEGRRGCRKSRVSRCRCRRTFSELSLPAHLCGGVVAGVFSVKCHYRRTFREVSLPVHLCGGVVSGVLSVKCHYRRTFREVSLPAHLQCERHWIWMKLCLKEEIVEERICC
jgi:hypothetical protein